MPATGSSALECSCRSFRRPSTSSRPTSHRSRTGSTWPTGRGRSRRDSPTRPFRPMPQRRLRALAARALAFVDEMNFRFLYDRQRQIFAIGYRLADAEGPGRLDPSFYDLLASEARLASFVAIAKGDVPDSHWFHLGRLLTSVDGASTLLSWSATLFEYLMPHAGDEELLRRPCWTSRAAAAVRRQVEYGRQRRRAVGHLRVRLQRRSTATATTSTRPSACRASASSAAWATNWWWRPTPPRWPRWWTRRRAAQNFRRLAREGAEGPYGFYEAIDYTHRKARRQRAGGATRRAHGARGRRGAAVPGPPPGHEPGGAGQHPARRRDGAPLPRRSAGAGHGAAAAGARAAPRADHPAPARRGDAGRGRGRPPWRVRRFRSPAHPLPARPVPLERRVRHRRHQRRRRRQPLPRPRGHPLPRGRHPRPRAASSSTCATCAAARSGRRPTSPTAREPEEYLVTFQAGARRVPPDGRRHRDPARHRGLHRGRRRGPPPGGDQPERPASRTGDHQLRRDRARAARRRPGAPGVRQALHRDGVPAGERRAALRPPASRAGGGRGVGGARAERRGTDAGAGGVGDRPPPVPRAGARPRGSRGARRAGALGHHRRRAGSDREPAPAHPPAPGGFVRHRPSPPAWPRAATAALAIAHKYHDPERRRPHLRAGLHPGAEHAAAHGHLQRRGPALRAPRLARAVHRRLAARRRRRSCRGTCWASRASGRTASPGDLPDPPGARGRGGRHPAGAPGAAGPGVLAAQGTERRRRDPERASGELPRRDARAARGAARHRAVGRLEAPARRRVPAARRPHERGRARSCSGGRGARDPQRRARRARRPARPALCRAAVGAGAAGAAAGAGSGARRQARSRRPTSPSPTAPAASPRAGASTPSCSTATRRRRCPG